ncbi:MAG: hypothetical protein ACI89T_002428 [Cognaticolwellia sp.]|jgi:hypothetical protein
MKINNNFEKIIIRLTQLFIMQQGKIIIIKAS